MTSRDRLLAVLKGEMPDRAPVSCYELVGFDSRNFCNIEPSYKNLMDYIREKTDCICMWNPQSNERLGLTAYDAGLTQEKIESDDGFETISRIELKGRKLTRRERVIKGIESVWETEPLCKDTDDVDAVMSIPFAPVTYSAEDSPRILSELGDHGILMPSLGDPAYLTMSLMEFGESLVWAMTETDHFAEVVREFHRRNMINLKNMLDSTPADLYRICGPEYMCPPYLPPSFFERFMQPYLADMVQLIHSYGRLVRIHCHGKISRVIDMIVDTGCDGVDPCEEAPDGDTTLESLKQRVGSRICLFGSMQLKLLENGSVADVVRETRRMMLAGKEGGRFVLMPTAAPINIPLRARTEENYRAFIDTALEYASY